MAGISEAWGDHAWGEAAWAAKPPPLVAGTDAFATMLKDPNATHVYAVELYPYKSG